MTDRQGLLDMLADLLVPIHREGHRYIGLAALATLVLFLVAAPLGWLAALATIALALMFRDPDRVVPLRAGLVLSPADGKVIAIDEIEPPADLGLGPERRVSVAIGLSPLDVHITRSPVAGTLVRSLYIPGAYFNPTFDKASAGNERRMSLIRTERGADIAVVQIAGLIARRIVAFKEDGAPVGAGERLGLIRLGSRVDVYLPPGHRALVAVGQRMIGGETVIADLLSDEAGREARRI